MPVATPTLQESLAGVLGKLKKKYDNHAFRTVIKREDVSEAKFMNGEPLFGRDETRQMVAEFLGGRPMDEQAVQALLVRLNQEIHLAGFSKSLTVGYIYSPDHHGMIFVLARIAVAEPGF